MAKKLFIVGNGFDLSLGLPTSYSDFLVYLMAKFHLHTLNQDLESKLAKGTFINPNKVMIPNYNISFLNLLNNTELKPTVKIKNFDFQLKKYNNLTLTSSYLERLIKESPTNSKDNWADLESAYFEFLIEQSRLHSANKNISKLNLEFLELRNQLAQYLERLFNFETEISRQHVDFLEHICRLKRLNLADTERDYEFSFENIHFINFNYTNTLTAYLKRINPLLSKSVIHIHGSLEDPNSIILGYGNKSGEEYKTLLNKRQNEYMRFFKHNQLAFEKAEKEIKRLINSEQFEVYILGHSLNQTDETILQTILNSSNLSRITLLFKDEDHYRSMKLNIERIAAHYDNLYIDNLSDEYLIPQKPDKFVFKDDFFDSTLSN